MKVGTLLKSISITSTLLAIVGASGETPWDIIGLLFGLSIALAWLLKTELGNTSMAKVSLNFPTEELKNGITIREFQ